MTGVQTCALPIWLNAAPVAEDGTFTVEGAMPGRVVIYSDRRSCRFEEEVEVPAGGSVDVVLRGRATGRITFRTESSSPANTLWIFWSEGSGEMTFPTSFGGSRARDLDWSTNVAPGKIRWKAEFRESDEKPGEFGTPPEGDLEVAAGETKVVVIPVPR